MHNILDRISYHAIYDDSIMSALRFAVANGFAGVQVAVEAPHLLPENIGEAEQKEIGRHCRTNQLRISLHGPDDSTSLFTASKHLVGGIFRYLESIFEFAEKVGAKLTTLHLGVMPAFATAPRPGKTLPDVDYKSLRRAFQTNLQRLVDLAAERFVLCVENVGLTPVVCEALQRHLDNEELSLCWDLAKCRDDPSVERWLWANLQHVRQVHLHDVCHGYSHQILGSGTLDFMSFLPRLAQANVMDYCIEVRPREKALESLVNLRALIRSMS